MKTIIKGALYFDGETILRAHYSGEFYTVDMTEYKTKETIKSEYSKEPAKEFLKGTCIEYKGLKYYECEYSPYNTEDLDLLSDISNLEFYEEETIFN